MSRLNPTEINELLERHSGGVVCLVGAGGCGMSALGHLLLDLGFGIIGSDLADNADTRQLAERGAEIRQGHHAAWLRERRPFLVVYSSAIPADNVELTAARQLNLPIVRRAALLAALVRRRHGVCVAGMHGKTTTSALLAHALKELAQCPSYAIGGGVPQLGRHAAFQGGGCMAWQTVPASAAPAETESAGTFFVAETDESDGTLRLFEPRQAILLNLDEEHLDYFAGLEAIIAEFQAFAARTAERLFYCADDPTLVELFARRGADVARAAPTVSFGFNPLADYQLEATGATGDFTVRRRGEWFGRFTTRLLGEKNVSNCGAVVAFLAENGFAAEAIAPAIASFRGAGRRQELLYSGRDIRVYQDYGHHPREIQATIAALRTLRPERLLVAFQPHRYSRTQHLLGQFATCFRGVDQLWLTEIYAASETPVPGINSALLAGCVRAQGQAVELVPELDALPEALAREVRAGDVVLFLGAGDIAGAAARLAARLRTVMKANDPVLIEALRGVLSPAGVVRPDEPLAKRTTLRVGGPADCLVEPATEADAVAVLEFCTRHQLPVMALGRGSNLLVRDGGIRGVVLSFAHENFSRVEVDGARLRCGAGVRLKQVANVARDHGIAGLEFLEGIPGNVGGALRMNAGAMGAETFQRLESVRVLDRHGRIRDVPASELEVHYRGCPDLKNAFALAAVFRGEPGARADIEARMREGNQKRWKTQPPQPSAGCMFKNPAAIPAGKLVDELGLKGLRVGGAAVSDVHGNFIVNEGHATARDVIELMERIKARALAERGIELHTEVQIVGEDLGGAR